MKNFLATTALVLVMGGAAYAAPAQFNTYQAQASDVQASDFIGQTIYASDTDFTADQTVKAGAEKDWDNIGEINEVVLGRDGSIKAVVLGVGGFLGIGEKNVAVSMNDVRFVRNGDGANDYFLVVNSTKEALNAAPAYMTPDDVKAAANNAADTTNATDTASDTTTPAMTDDTAANTDMAKPADTATNTMAKPADTADDQASSTMTTPDATATDTDTQTTASTKSDNAVQSTMEEARARLARPEVTREGYQSVQMTELTADKLEGARVYGAKDEDVGEINRLVMDDKGQVKLFVLDIGGFLGMGEREIAVTPDELNIVRNAKGDDFRVYVEANKDALKAQPEYKAQ